jgi:hypothetical protein
MMMMEVEQVWMGVLVVVVVVGVVEEEVVWKRPKLEEVEDHRV